MDEQLGLLDELEVPDDWAEMQRRSPRHHTASQSSSWRRGMVIVTALAITIATTGIMVRAFHHVSHTASVTGDPNDWQVGTVPAFGISFSYPPQWRLQPFAEQIGTIHFQGVLISNTDLQFEHPTPSDGGATSAWDLSRLPADGLVISIEQIGGGPASTSRPSSADTALPLSLSEARLLAPQPDPLGSSPKPAGTEERLLDFVLNGQGVELRVFLAPQASAQTRAAAADVVASIEPTGGGGPTPSDAAATTISVASPGSMMSAFGALWIQSGNTLERRDASTGELLDTVQADSTRGISDGISTLTSGFGSVWWLVGESVLRIDPTDLSVSESIPLPSRGSSITEGEGSIWVGVVAGYDLGIDPATDRIVVKTSPVSSPSGSLAVGGGSIWSQADSEAARIERYDGATGHLVSSFPIGVSSLTYRDGSLWGLANTGKASSLLRISPESGSVLSETHIDSAALGLTASGKEFWVNSGGFPIRIDGTNGTILETPSERQVGYQGSAIALGDGTVWLVVPDLNLIRGFSIP